MGTDRGDGRNLNSCKEMYSLADLNKLKFHAGCSLTSDVPRMAVLVPTCTRSVGGGLYQIQVH
jgi:hypothetical protein